MTFTTADTSITQLRLEIENQFGRAVPLPLWQSGLSMLSKLWEVEFTEYEQTVLGAILTGLANTQRYHENLFLLPERADNVATHSLQTAALLRDFLVRSATYSTLSHKARRLLLLSCFVHDVGEILGEPGSVDNRHNREAKKEDLDFEDIVVNGILSQLVQAADEGIIDTFTKYLFALQQEVSPTLFALKTSPQSEIVERTNQLVSLVQRKLLVTKRSSTMSPQAQRFLKELFDAHALADHESLETSYADLYDLEGHPTYWQAVFKSIDRGEGIFYFITNSYSPSHSISALRLAHWFNQKAYDSIAWKPSPSDLVIPFNLAPSYILSSYLKYAESHCRGLINGEEKYLPLTTALLQFKLSESCTIAERGPDQFNLSIPKPTLDSLRVEVLSPYWSSQTPHEKRPALHSRILDFCHEQRLREKSQFKTFDKSIAVALYLSKMEKVAGGDIHQYIPVYEELASIH